jgi:hypothetical protein
VSGAALDQREQFFYDHAGTSYDPATETPEEGRVRGARALAAAELHRLSADWYVVWSEDPEPFDDDVHDGSEQGYIATLYDRDGNDLANLGQIDADEHSPYRRVVEAELTAEALAEAEEQGQ